MNDKPNLLITGISGFLGSNLAVKLRENYSVAGVFLKNYPKITGVVLIQTDLADEAKINRVFDRVNPHIIIHNAAMADPDRCERETHVAETVNVRASHAIARLAAKRGIRLLFTSTDLVFDGNNPPYKETDSPNPLSVYARTKVEGEGIVQSVCPNALILRISLMFGRGAAGIRHNTEWLERELISRHANHRSEPLPLYTNQYRSMLGVLNTCEIIGELCGTTDKGILHVGSGEKISRYEFGKLLCNALNIPTSNIRPVSMEDNNTSAAVRPRDVSLDITRLKKTIKTRVLTIREEVERIYGTG